MKSKIWLMAFFLVLAIHLNAQETENNQVEKSKKELRQERKEAKKQDREAYRLYGKSLLEERNFVLKADRLQNSKTGKLIVAIPEVNFIKIDGEDITLQFGNVSNIGINGVGGVTYNGKVQKYELFDRGEGKSAGVMIQYSSIYARNLITLYIEVNGDQATARFNENGTIINLMGQFEPFEGSSIWEGTNRRDF